MVQHRPTASNGEERGRPSSGPGGMHLVSKQDRPVMMMVERATKHYKTRSGSVHALEDLSLEIADGEFVCILGPSGCGKSTLLWAMSVFMN